MCWYWLWSHDSLHDPIIVPSIPVTFPGAVVLLVVGCIVIWWMGRKIWCSQLCWLQVCCHSPLPEEGWWWCQESTDWWVWQWETRSWIWDWRSEEIWQRGKQDRRQWRSSQGVKIAVWVSVFGTVDTLVALIILWVSLVYSVHSCCRMYPSSLARHDVTGEWLPVTCSLCKPLVRTEGFCHSVSCSWYGEYYNWITAQHPHEFCGCCSEQYKLVGVGNQTSGRIRCLC